MKAPTVKPAEARVRAEPTPSPQFPFADTPETFKSQAGIEVKKEVGVSITGVAVREERFEALRERETKVGGHWSPCCLLIHSRGAGPGTRPIRCPAFLHCSDFILSSMVWVRPLLELFL